MVNYNIMRDVTLTKQVPNSIGVVIHDGISNAECLSPFSAAVRLIPLESCCKYRQPLIFICLIDGFGNRSLRLTRRSPRGKEVEPYYILFTSILLIVIIV